ncbi:MAG: hypothetical protein KJO67_15160 [Silicimonas sp.]|nr:hypothetical protein [Silicimonas sp.]
MDMTETLDAMRSDLPGCSLVVFTDLGSKLVLCTSAASKPAQEELDRLSDLAQTVLDGGVAEGAQPVLASGGGDARAGVAILASGNETKVFLRAPGEAAEALTCICGPDADLQKVVDCGRATLDGIVAAS